MTTSTTPRCCAPSWSRSRALLTTSATRSLTREGWILSLSNWRDEKSLVRWRTHMRHHEVQQKGRDKILADYYLRVGQITADNQVPAGYALTEQRLDETEIGEGTTVTLINATRAAEWKQTNNPYDCAEWLGLNPWAADSTSWDIFDAVLTPGDLDSANILEGRRCSAGL